MGKQPKSKKSPENNGVIGKGKVTPVQVAFIVDRYLSDNNFVQTRSTFRTEASHLISKLPVNEAHKSLLSLGDMLDEYISLKEQKVILNQEKIRLEQDNFRVQNLLQGMQGVMNAYNAPAVYNTPVMMSASRPSNSLSETPTTTTSQPTLRKRKNNKDASGASKRTHGQPSVKPILQPQTALQIPSNCHVIKPSPVQSSSVAKCLFNPGPQTPSPTPSPIDKSVINNQSPQQFTSTNRTIITSETIQVSPMKQVSYYSVQRNNCISSPIKNRFTTRDHVKGRLDFDENLKPDDVFDFDLPNLDCLGVDFNLTELLGDFDFDGQQHDYLTQPDNGSSPSGSPETLVNGCTQMSSTVTEIRSEQDMNLPGPNSVTSVKSVTKCIKVFSPVKKCKITESDQEISDDADIYL